MYKALTRYTIATISLFTTACSTVSVTTDHDPSAPFAHYKTYTLAPSTEKVGLSPSSEAALQDSLRTELLRHGISETGENADLHVVRHISTKEKTVVHQSGPGLPYRYGRYRMWVGAPYYYTDVSQYTQGTLILDFVDAKTHKLVFRGVGTGTVSDPKTNAERVREAVEEIVQNFPKGAKQ